MREIQTKPKDGSVHLRNYDEHQKAVAAFNKSMAKEREWRELVAQGKAREVREPVLNGYRYHFELIND